MSAYNDAAGITRAFNLNLLTRINRELGNFDVSQFEHVATYDESEGIMRSYLRSTKAQEVHIEKLDERFTFEKEEEVLVEISRKYNDDILSSILKEQTILPQSEFG
jgi:L-histidine N-alpha-methyltransferase